ncbi:MAG: ferrochelatase [Proteobacteria bacterium]|nr:ferrochelatase [Pseudomonadota bacterium]NCA28053.1 ferrochelatase [Pseudomonadota bacterium]
MPKFNHKTAVILFNLGGPDKLSSVKPFLFNLFNDKAIISIPQPFRFLLAKLISSKREEKAQNIYQKIGGKSPLLDITLSQADSLERELSFNGNFKVFTVMRYWHPFAHEVVKKVHNYQPDEIILLPLYPQYSSTTSASSIKDFGDNFMSNKIPIKIVCCYPNQDDFIKSHCQNILKSLQKIKPENHSNIRILFSAHGLPQKVIDKGDPYVFQVENSVKNIIDNLAIMIKKIDTLNISKIDHQICYQSKVGPLKWTSPSLEQEIRKVALDKKIPVIVPIAFISDHSETLVELDIEYKELAEQIGIQEYHRVNALNIDRNFINALSKIVLATSKNRDSAIFCGENPARICPKNFKLCPNQNRT